jgi:HAD superfamily hydrolase (TIGR01509 family)
LSNTNPVHWLPCSEVLEGCFEKVFLSYEMHLVKPSQEIFERMLQETGIKSEETLFIDDSKANCLAAESLGIRTLHVGHGDEWLDQLDELL